MVSPEIEPSLTNCLQSLEKALKRAWDERQTDNRSAALTALQGVIEFINAIPLLESQSLALPLTDLMAALHDLRVGRVGRMLRPPRGFDNRKPEASQRKVIRAFARFGVEQLKIHGMTTDEEACAFVAKQLERARVPIGGKPSTPSWKTVRSWLYYGKQRSPDDQERHTLESLRAQVSFPQDMPLHEVKNRLAQLLPAVLTQIQVGLE
jgi:hypothetical protein